jgi:hypothetical protein
MDEPKVWVFFYGSFINRQVLARGGLVPDRVEVARSGASTSRSRHWRRPCAPTGTASMASCVRPRTPSSAACTARTGWGDTFAQSVEGLWQGLKVFEKEDIDPSRWQITDLRGIKWAGRSRGKVLGHRFGVGSNVLLGYRDARCQIYLPAYRWVLENRLAAEVKRLRDELSARPVVLLDYETNADLEELSRPLSHAALIVRYLEGKWPTVG